MDTTDDPCEILPWDSKFFGFVVARVRPSRISSKTCKEIDQWCIRNGVRCLYFLADSTDSASANIAQDSGFRFVDQRVTLERSLDGPRPAAQPSVRSACDADLDALRAIARESHRDSRYYFDSGFSRERCEALYERWIEASYRGSADFVLTSGPEGSPNGYVTGHLGADQLGSLGLVAVAASAQGTGVGISLVTGALARFHDLGIKQVRVVTQARNVPALHLYARTGFLIKAVQTWYHVWQFGKERSL